MSRVSSTFSGFSDSGNKQISPNKPTHWHSLAAPARTWHEVFVRVRDFLPEVRLWSAWSMFGMDIGASKFDQWIADSSRSVASHVSGDLLELYVTPASPEAGTRSGPAARVGAVVSASPFYP